GVAALPKDPGLNESTRRTLADALRKEPPQHRVRGLVRDSRCRPALWPLVPHGGQCRAPLGRQGKGPDRGVRGLDGGVFRVFARPQGGCPPVCQRGSDPAVSGLDPGAGWRRPGRRVPTPRQGWGVRRGKLPLGLWWGGHRAGLERACAGPAGLDKGLDPAGSDGSRGAVWPDRDAIVRAAMGAHGARRGRIRAPPGVRTRPTVAAPLHERGAGSWEPAGFVASRLGIVRSAPRLELRQRLPANRGGVLSLAADVPRGEGTALLGGRPLSWILAHLPA